MNANLRRAIVTLSLLSLLLAPFVGASRIGFDALFQDGARGLSDIMGHKDTARAACVVHRGYSLRMRSYISGALPQLARLARHARRIVRSRARGGDLYPARRRLFVLRCNQRKRLRRFPWLIRRDNRALRGGGLKRGEFSAPSLLLAGIALNFLFSSLNMIIQLRAAILIRSA